MGATANDAEAETNEPGSCEVTLVWDPETNSIVDDPDEAVVHEPIDDSEMNRGRRRDGKRGIYR